MRVIIGATALSVLLLPSLASSAILTMSEACAVPSGIDYCELYQEQGFQVVDSPISFGFPVFGVGFGGIAVFSDLTQGVRVSRIDGQPFDSLAGVCQPLLLRGANGIHGIQVIKGWLPDGEHGHHDV